MDAGMHDLRSWSLQTVKRSVTAAAPETQILSERRDVGDGGIDRSS